MIRPTAHFALFLTCFIANISVTHAQPFDQSRSVGDISRSDSMDILHTRIELDLTDVGNGNIAARTTMRFTPRINAIGSLTLDLLPFAVDSVTVNDLALTFTHVGEELTITLDQSYDPGDTVDIVVIYHGDPVVDASGWGGFYTLSTYQYDLGVAFDAIPHSYGRSWFPCFDNFVERCTFDFIVRTSNDRTVFANGALIDTTDLGGGIRLTHWAIAEPIPSYLASVASTNYVAVRDTFPSVAGNNVPVTLVAHPSDTSDMKSSFVHLQNAFDSYERWFGPYQWERVGFTLTSQGAMEHPTNVCYPDFAADGSLANERLFAHELSHHWFGDLITCRRAEEMYINEGFADFCSYLFLEDLYGRPAYDSYVWNVHHAEVSKAHLIDAGWYALDSIPQEYTYGETTYKKGADVVRTLRSYLGDSLFSLGLKRVLTNNAFSDMSTTELRDSLNVATNANLTNFFNDWIMQPGWVAFEVDSMHSTQSGSVYPTTIHLQQKLRHAEHRYAGVPVTLTLEDALGNRWQHPLPIVLSGEFPVIASAPPFIPAHAFINNDQRLALATTLYDDTITTANTQNLPLVDLQLVVSALPAPAPIRIEELWVAADDFTSEPFAFVVSPDRWWRVSGQFAPGTNISATIAVDGGNSINASFDQGLMQDSAGVVFSEDSLVLLYRPNAHFPWSVHPDFSVNFQGPHTDKRARITFQGLTEGDYAMAWRRSSVGISEDHAQLRGWCYFPNPADDMVTVEAPRSAQGSNARLLMQDANGRILGDHPISGTRTRIDLHSITSEIVFLTAVVPGEGSVVLGRLVVVAR